MDSRLGNHLSPDSLKRKRGRLTEDDTSDPERDRLLEKKNKVESNEVDTTVAIPETVDIAEDLNHAGGSRTYLPSTIASHDSTSTKTDTAEATAEAEPVPPKPSLQTLPRELRDLIYDFVAATEERIVLGWRMVETRQNNSTWTLDQCFDAAVALHPLSMTCHQFRNEFQEEHFSAAEPSWVLLVNNFDLEQLQTFSDYIESEEYVKVTGRYGIVEEDWPYNVPVYNHHVSLRFQMDDLAPISASEFCKNVFFEHRGNAPLSLADDDLSLVWLGIAGIATQYAPRTTAPVANRQSMTLGQATDIKAMFGALYAQIVELPDFLVYLGDSSTEDGNNEIPDSFSYMDWCWFDEFDHAVELMREAEGAGGRARKRPTRS